MASFRGALARARRIAWSPLRKPVKTAFHRLYYTDQGPQTWEDTWWMGTRILKCPLDMWQYQEAIVEKRPDFIVETGTFNGGSALFFGHLFDLLGGEGRVLSIDIEPQPGLPEHPRVEFMTASSIGPEALAKAREMAARAERVMVVLDSDHSASHVAAELKVYAELVSPGQYLVVEDGNVNGHPVLRSHGPGPSEAVRAFLSETAEFSIDPRRERHLLTFNPGGWLLKSR